MSKWPKCPKCRSQNVVVTEVWTAVIVWTSDMRRSEGLLDEGNPFKVEGKCQDCEHVWRFRGIVQINDDWWSEEDHAND